jgi:hypothetical protein
MIGKIQRLNLREVWKHEGNLVVVENQMEKSDHDHLGKVITYLTAIDAKAAIWIVADPRRLPC